MSKRIAIIIERANIALGGAERSVVLEEQFFEWIAYFKNDEEKSKKNEQKDQVPEKRMHQHIIDSLQP